MNVCSVSVHNVFTTNELKGKGRRLGPPNAFSPQSVFLNRKEFDCQVVFLEQQNVSFDCAFFGCQVFEKRKKEVAGSLRTKAGIQKNTQQEQLFRPVKTLNRSVAADQFIRMT